MHLGSTAGSCDWRARRYNPLSEPWAAEANRGLSRFLVFLREQEELAAAAALEALKPVGTQVSERARVLPPEQAFHSNCFAHLGAAPQAAVHVAS